jgi:Mn-dependent DtxR family transcriptional regulator
LTLGITIYVIVSVILFYRYLFISTFQPVIAQTMGISTRLIHYFVMLLLSFAVVASLRTVGVILVVAMLITPASTALLISNRLKQVISLAALIGMFAAVAGLLLAIIFDTTPGPAMAIVATLVYLLTAFFSPAKGLVFEYFRSRHQRVRIRMEDILKQSFRLQTDRSLSFAQLMTKIDIEKAQLRRLLRKLAKKGYLHTTDQSIIMNDSGLAEATRLIRAHRLWETFLVDQIGLNEGQIHEEAEKYEHLLTDEILDEVDRELGYPTTDPHGSPIPSRKGLMIKSLWQLKLDEEAIISKTQPNQLIAVDLWKLGLLPGSVIKVTSVKDGQLKMKSSGKEYEIIQSLALNIHIEKTSPS